LIEDYAEKLNIKAIKEIEKAKVRFGDAFNEAEFVSTNLELLSIKLERERF
jgi:glycyl-tRNA synthetase